MGTSVTELREASSSAPPRRARPYLVLGVLVVLVASPIAVAGLSLVGDTWHPSGDWAALVHRVSQVGTSETPLVGAYSVRGWAHPGPLGFWVSAPLYELTGGDARSLMWTAGLVNVVAIAGMVAVAWRRGRWPLALAVTVLAAVLVRGIGVELLIDPWNPLLPLLAFALTILLVWDAALGRRRALIEAVVPASLAMQCHFAFIPLLGLTAVWLVAWLRWDLSGRGDGGHAGGAEQREAAGDDHPLHVEGPDRAGTDGPATGGGRAGAVVRWRELAPWRELWRSWSWPLRAGLGIAVVLWLGPLYDAAFDLHNPWNVVRSLGAGGDRIGPVAGIGVVGRYVRPDGPWMGASEPAEYLSVAGSGPLPLLIALGVLAGCVHLGRRRGLRDVSALASLTMVLLVGAIPAASQLPIPTMAYLTQWLKVVGGLLWFTLAWTLWRVCEPAVRAVPARRVALVGAAVCVSVAAVLSQYGTAVSYEHNQADAGALMDELHRDLQGELPDEGATVRVVRRGDYFQIYAAGLVGRLAADGHDVVTDAGSAGLKWGHAHRWTEGEHYDTLLTVAVDRAVEECARAPATEELARVDRLAPEERAWLADAQLRRLEGPEAVSDEEAERMADLGRRDKQVGVFEGTRPCAEEQEHDPTGAGGDDVLPVAAAGIVVVAALGGWYVTRRRRSL